MLWKKRSRKVRVILLGALTVPLMCACDAIMDLVGYDPSASSSTPVVVAQLEEGSAAPLPTESSRN